MRRHAFVDRRLDRPAAFAGIGHPAGEFRQVRILDPREAGKILTELAKKARKNAGMNGLDLD